MKVTIRRSVFETNSSSNHCLILTTKDKLEEEIERIRNENKFDFSYGTEEYPIVTKEDKCYLLAGVMEEQLSYKKGDYIIYEIFKQVLKDNNELEILAEVEQHMIDQLENYYCYFCEDYFEHGCLIDCGCDFLILMEEYFDVHVYGEYDDDCVLHLDDDAKNKLYQMFYIYIYEDVVVIPYEYL